MKIVGGEGRSSEPCRVRVGNRGDEHPLAAGTSPPLVKFVDHAHRPSDARTPGVQRVLRRVLSEGPNRPHRVPLDDVLDDSHHVVRRGLIRVFWHSRPPYNLSRMEQQYTMWEHRMFGTIIDRNGSFLETGGRAFRAELPVSGAPGKASEKPGSAMNAPSI